MSIEFDPEHNHFDGSPEVLLDSKRAPLIGSLFDDRIGFILWQCFPPTKAAQVEGIGAVEKNKLDTQVLRRRAELEGLPAIELNRLFCAALDAWRLETSEEVLEEGLAFMQPKFQADAERWGRYPRWTVDQAVALFLDRDPDKFVWADADVWAAHSPRLLECRHLHRLAKGAVQNKDLGETTQPHIFLEWSAGHGLHYPSRISDVVIDHYTEEPINTESQEIWTNMSTKEKNNVFRLLLTFAAVKYGHNPHHSTAWGTTEMSEDMKALGFKSSPPTIKKLLARIKDMSDKSKIEEFHKNQASAKARGSRA